MGPSIQLLRLMVDIDHAADDMGLGEGFASAKHSRLLEILPELSGERRRVIVFGQFTSMLDLIAADTVILYDPW